MQFQPGNQESKKADHKRARVITQQLTSALNEAYDENDRTKLRAMIDTWIANAIKGDQSAINSIADRIEGKPMQSMEHSGHDGGPIETNADPRSLALAVVDLLRQTKD
jgi:hypothetical protein